jgi:hypothetical protein
VDAVEAMPGDKLDFSPESVNIPGDDYKGVRTFGVQVKHVAASNDCLWASITGDHLPDDYKGGNGPEKLRAKADIVVDVCRLVDRAAVDADDPITGMETQAGNGFSQPETRYFSARTIGCGRPQRNAPSREAAERIWPLFLDRSCQAERDCRREDKCSHETFDARARNLAAGETAWTGRLLPFPRTA